MPRAMSVQMAKGRSLVLVGTSLAVVWSCYLSAAMAQSSPPVRRGQAAALDGAFAKLSRNNQEIARALYLSQNTRVTTPPLTLDEIAARRQKGEGWGHICESMRTQGLVDHDLAHIMTNYNHRQRTAPPQARPRPEPRS